MDFVSSLVDTSSERTALALQVMCDIKAGSYVLGKLRAVREQGVGRKNK